MKNTNKELKSLDDNDQELVAPEDGAREAESSLTRGSEEEHATTASKEAPPAPRKVVSDGLAIKEKPL